MAQLVPIEAGVTDQEFSVSLDGVEYVVRLTWQDRDESWYIDVRTVALAPVAGAMGLRVATGVPLLAQVVTKPRPAGELIAIDTLGEDKDPDLDDFGFNENLPENERALRVQLVYLSADDVAEARGA